ncbi:EF-hand calcium-binding domain protein [Talaromyces proteolyticus]|uniref:EF-hand calcium-binding domain protein n=1 Tax=Talaromyces proteolyticus TaxID=1131652 RepID=A0AAD4L086_9EURO|nr:EF-hand calcium-binding domain protein [Talaromyces proteolyticus]KAH8703110.1 EF-hand calcium-binding domain protein [Talaromyces proteolyticus]
MRFLCLHGRGTNADIFESQLAALHSRISSEHTFDFIDAEFDCPPAPGIGDLFAPPYLCWYSQFDPTHIQTAHDYIRSTIEEDGPYDGVIGFSEGAALAASFLISLQHRNDESGGNQTDLLFKVAIFFNSAIVLSPSKTLGSNITQWIAKSRAQLIEFIHCNPKEFEKLPDTFGFTSICLSSFKSRIAIPTLHVIGERDGFVDDARQLVEFCCKQTAEVFVHSGGHELPRDEATLDRFATRFEAVIALAAVV